MPFQYALFQFKETFYRFLSLLNRFISLRLLKKFFLSIPIAAVSKMGMHSFALSRQMNAGGSTNELIIRHLNSELFLMFKNARLMNSWFLWYEKISDKWTEWINYKKYTRQMNLLFIKIKQIPDKWTYFYKN